jgi:hypothetical protein
VDSGPCGPAMAATHSRSLVDAASLSLVASYHLALTCAWLDSFFSETRDICGGSKRCQQGTIRYTSSNCTFLTTLASAINLSYLRKQTVAPPQTA